MVVQIKRFSLENLIVRQPLEEEIFEHSILPQFTNTT